MGRGKIMSSTVDNQEQTPVVEVKNVSHDFMTMSTESTFRVLEDISFQVNKGQLITIVGTSGCGKSTLLRIIAGLIQPSEGEILLDGNPIKGPDANRGMVFQQDAVFPWLTVRRNIEYGLRIRGMNQRKIKEKSDRWIKLVGLEGWESAYPKELSGGMRKRVDLARVYANGPEVMLMDEPFGALDAQTKSNMQEELLKLWRNVRSTVLFVTHDLEEAAFLSDIVIIMSPRPGMIKSIVEIDLPRPRTEELRLSSEFLEAKKLLFENLKGAEQ
jgi:NitT/TauT family transport system ATP-binding protein